MNIHNECPTKSNVCALVISYHPESAIYSKVLAVISQVDRIFVVDNGSSEIEREPLVNARTYSDAVELVFNEKNMGQAKALNTGIELAKKCGYKWVLLLDQDSLLAENMVEAMSLCYKQYDDNQSVGSICPVLASYNGISPASLDSIELRSFSGIRVKGLFSLVKIAITSGNLINLDVFDEVGTFDEGFFIDYVDQEFCLRLSQASYKIIQANQAVLYHNIGNTVQHSLFGKRVLVANNSSIRSYYFYRNAIIVYKRYFFRDFMWVCQDLVKGCVINLLKIVLFESNRLDKSKKILLGLIDGLMNKSGEYKSLD
jgi:rhamnosyltransferase